jgi:AraC family transcriptional regulator, melibiose operon regulatory protein
MNKVVLRTDHHQQEVGFPLDDTFPIEAVTWRLSTFARGRFDCHWHAAIEFERVVEGEMVFEANGERFTVQRGEGVYLAANTLHSAWLEHTGDCEYQVVRVDPSLLSGPVGTRLFADLVKPVLLDPRLAFLHLRRNDPWQADLLDRIGTFQTMIDAAEPGWELGAMNWIFGVWHLLHQFAETLPKQEVHLRNGRQPARDVERMQRALMFIEKHYGDRITLADIASSMLLSEGECCRLFQRMLHTSPMEYVVSSRIRESLTLLVDTHLPITEIAQRTGFSGSSYFTETFRKGMGITPSAYRKEIRARKEAGA